MEVIQWTGLWNTFKDEFENEKNMLGGSLGDKAADDLKERVIEHVTIYTLISHAYLCYYNQSGWLGWVTGKTGVVSMEKQIG